MLLYILTAFIFLAFIILVKSLKGGAQIEKGNLIRAGGISAAFLAAVVVVDWIVPMLISGAFYTPGVLGTILAFIYNLVEIQILFLGILGIARILGCYRMHLLLWLVPVLFGCFATKIFLLEMQSIRSAMNSFGNMMIYDALVSGISITMLSNIRMALLLIPAVVIAIVCLSGKQSAEAEK